MKFEFRRIEYEYNYKIIFYCVNLIPCLRVFTLHHLLTSDEEDFIIMYIPDNDVKP